MVSESSSQLEEICATCGERLRGAFCSACGEKKIRPEKDLALRKFIEQAVDGFTHFDNKFFRSFGLLLARPGFLTAEYITGRRVKYMKPVQIFILASLLFFVVSPNTGSFYALLEEMQSGHRTGSRLENLFRYDIDAKLVQAARAESLPARDVWFRTEAAAAKKSKTFLFAMLPVWALMLYGLFRRRNAYYVPHLVFAVHSFSFFLLLDLAYINALFLFTDYISDLMILPIVLAFAGYVVLGMKRAYGVPLGEALFKGAAGIIGLFLIILIYRQLITIWALSSH